MNLKKVQNLKAPSREETLRRDSSVTSFWQENKEILSSAWQEWEKIKKFATNFKGNILIDDNLYSAIQATWENPEKEKLVENLLTEVSSGVFAFQFFDPKKLKTFRDYLEEVYNSRIPLRAPYGIVLNRKGFMIDARSDGHLATPSFQSLYKEIMNTYMRPISRLLFPEIFGFDTQTFGFSINYQPHKDTSIRMHTDASLVTLNINLNLHNEEFAGSEVDFHDPTTGKMNRVTFTPGSAMIHRGNIAHCAQPITSGERTNLVLWLYGDQMQIPRFIEKAPKLTPLERWSIPDATLDTSAPF